MDTDDVALVDKVVQHILDGTEHPALRWDAGQTGFRLRMQRLIPGSYDITATAMFASVGSASWAPRADRGRR